MGTDTYGDSRSVCARTYIYLSAEEKDCVTKVPSGGWEARTMVSVLTRVEDYLHSEIKRGMIKERRERGPAALGGGVGTGGRGC